MRIDWWTAITVKFSCESIASVINNGKICPSSAREFHNYIITLLLTTDQRLQVITNIRVGVIYCCILFWFTITINSSNRISPFQKRITSNLLSFTMKRPFRVRIKCHGLEIPLLSLEMKSERFWSWLKRRWLGMSLIRTEFEMFVSEKRPQIICLINFVNPFCGIRFWLVIPRGFCCYDLKNVPFLLPILSSQLSQLEQRTI